ncbi:MAG: OsmC family protein [Candidatus Heimdallarchaeota archaeon]
MNVVNRVNLDRLEDTGQKMMGDPNEAKKITRIEGEWLLDATEDPQFRAEIQTEKGTFSLEADQPTSLGGEGTRPGPMHYCLYGVASCTAATFATSAATEGVLLRKMSVTVESHMDFSKTMGISENPIVEEVKLQIVIDTDAGDEKIQELRKLTEARCPAVFCLSTPVKMVVEVTREGQDG